MSGEGPQITPDELRGWAYLQEAPTGGNWQVVIERDPIRQFVAVLSGRKNTIRYGERLRQQTPDWVEPFMSSYETAKD